jgi:two-component system phosphate regulon response regulator PhoB
MSTILVVDDERDTRNVLQLLLRLEGHEVIAASDGVAALQAVGERRPDVIITDWMMPRMNGTELCRRLREDPTTRAVPIIVVSARGLEPTHPDGLYERFLHKPFGLDELLEEVRTLLSERRS